VLAIVNSLKPEAQGILDELLAFLRERGLETGVCACATGGAEGKARKGDPVFSEPWDLCVALGGDGTVLFAARCLASSSVPIFPINLGTLGFIAEVHKDEWKEMLALWLEGRLGCSTRMMLDVELLRGEETVFSSTCLNDAVVSGSGIAKLVNLEVDISGMQLGTYRADGVIVSTPTGSTAYSVAAGGPILQPDMEALIIIPVCPFTLANRPIVLPGRERVGIKVAETQRSGLILTVDGQEVVELRPLDRIRISRAKLPARIVACDENRFYRALKTKLNWSGGPDA
jgi:NAD+ kinase